MQETSKIKERIAGTYVIQATMKNTAPLILGAGEDIDKEIMKDATGRAYIPVSSFMGCLKSAVSNISEIKSEYFWGSEAKSKIDSQSHINCLPIKTKDRIELAVFDGIAIDPKTQTVEDKAKYDYEAINNQVRFPVRIEIERREGFKKEHFDSLVGSIMHQLKEGLYLGAYTSSGFGKVVFEECKCAYYNYTDSSNRTIAKQWYQYRKSGLLDNQYPVFEHSETEVNDNHDLYISVELQLLGTLMSGFNIPEDESDKSSYYFDGKPAIYGKAIKGAIAQRMRKILNTLSRGKIDKWEKDFLELTGWGKEESKKYEDLGKVASKSRLHIDMAMLENATSIIHDRVKINRFTQGAIARAKFDSRPVVPRKDNCSTKMHFRIKNYQPWEAALLMHAIRDLYTGDLPIGGEKGIGRGRFIGTGCKINDKPIKECIQDVNDWNKAFNNKINEYEKAK